VPFDPKLIQPEDAPLDAIGELDLPDDLLELASQLRDDANYLAERYPAERSELPLREQLSPFPSRVRYWWVAGAAAAMVAVLASAYRPASLIPQATRTVSDAGSVAASDVTASQPGPIVATAEPTTSPAGESRIQRLPWAPESVVPTVSGPELEGLLDLWQNDGQELEPISI
jgi:hypothetical protein